MLVPITVRALNCGSCLADVRFGLREHLLQRLVGIDDVVVGIGHHHVGRSNIQRGFGHLHQMIDR